MNGYIYSNVASLFRTLHLATSFRSRGNNKVLPYGIRALSTSAPRFADLTLTFASSGEVFYDNQAVKEVHVPTLTGRFGVLAEHVPTIGCLKPGLVNVIEQDGGTKSFFVSSGIVTVNSDSTIQILAEEAATLYQIDGQAVKDGYARAQSDLASASTEVGKAEAQIAFEAYEELVRAVENRH